MTNESHTSSVCPFCNKKVTTNDRNFRCSHYGYKQDRDVVGSINILKKHIHDHQIDDIKVEDYPIVSKNLIEG
ncbi:MAG: transposase [Candidatus Lokiarchaeota archaeon]|nr:transposase [Candidatus Lokiarchaeota archaeon]